MKLTELIQTLQQLHTELGDVDVVFWDLDTGGYFQFTKANIERQREWQELEWENYLDEQKMILGMPGLLAKPCFIAGFQAALRITADGVNNYDDKGAPEPLEREPI